MTKEIFFNQVSSFKIAMNIARSLALVLLISVVHGKIYKLCHYIVHTMYYRGLFRTGAMGALAPTILKNRLLASAIF